MGMVLKQPGNSASTPSPPPRSLCAREAQAEAWKGGREGKRPSLSVWMLLGGKELREILSQGRSSRGCLKGGAGAVSGRDPETEN